MAHAAVVRASLHWGPHMGADVAVAIMAGQVALAHFVTPARVQQELTGVVVSAR